MLYFENDWMLSVTSLYGSSLDAQLLILVTKYITAKIKSRSELVSKQNVWQKTSLESFFAKSL